MQIQLHNDDCFKIFPKIKDNSIDLILADLPYGVTNCEWDKMFPLEPLWENYKRIIKKNGAIILTSVQPFTTDLINSNRKEFRYVLIWYKTRASGFLNAKKMPNRSHEDIVVFYKKLPTYNPVKYEISSKFIRKGKILGKRDTTLFNKISLEPNSYQYLDDGSRYPDSVLCFPSESKKGMHPTQKPLALIRFLVMSYSNPDDLVLDNTMGSGTTGVACVELGRRFIGIEKDKKFFNKARNRIFSTKYEYYN